MHQSSAGKTILVHHGNPSGLYQTCMIGMMLECSTGELHTKGIMHFLHYAALKGLTAYFCAALPN